jgi:hypothetical protein
VDGAANVHAKRKGNADEKHQIGGLAQRPVLLEQQLLEFLGPSQNTSDGRSHA